MLGGALMEAKLVKIENSEAYIDIMVDEKTVDDCLNQAYKKVVKQLNVPGFRKGKAPRSLLVAQYGKEVLIPDALEFMIPDAYEKAINQLDIDPIASPQFDLPDNDDIEPTFSFTAIVAVKPDVVLGSLEGIQITIPKMEINDNYVEASLKKMQLSYAEVIVKDTEPAEIGDRVTFDFEGFVDNMPFDGGKADDYQLVLGSKAFIPGFEEQMAGMVKGEEKELAVKFPEDYHGQEMAGKDAVFHVSIKSVEGKKLRALNDEFAQEVSDFETLAELRENIWENASNQAAERKKTLIRREVLDAAATGCTMVIPDPVVHERIKQMQHQLQQSLAMQGITLEQYYEYTKSSEEEFQKTMWPDAAQSVRINFMLEKIVDEKGFAVNDEELEKNVEEMAKDMAKDTDTSWEKAKELLSANLEQLRYNIQVDKAVDYLLENAIVVETDEVAAEEKIEHEE